MKRCMPRTWWPTLGSLVILWIALSPGLVASGRAADDALQTVAEKSEFKATSRSAEVVQLVDQIVQRAPHVQRVDFGSTVERRPMVAAVAARPVVRSPADLPADDPRLVVLLLGNIHSGECDGKEALLTLLREVALNPSHPWLDHFVLVFVPNYNADANDRVGLKHRPGQVGPEQGMGLRENAQGLDLNRDFVKLESPEARALVQLMQDWRVDLLIDTHTTDGSRHRYALTYDVPHNPAAAAGPRDFLRTELLPAVTQRLQKQGVSTFFYGNLNQDHSRWTTFGHEPRYSTEYVGLRGKLAILSESYAYISYQQRIEATRAFVRACLDELAARQPKARELLAEAARQTTERGAKPAMGDQVSVRAQVTAFPEKATILGFERQTGTNQPQPSDQPHDYQVDFYGLYKPTREVQRPFAYLVPHDQSRVADRLRMHGIQLERLVADQPLEVELYRADELRRNPGEFNGHRLLTAKVTSRSEKRTVPAGTYVVRTAQPLGNLLVYLLEPESDDGLVTWNFFDPVWTQQQDYPVQRLVAPVELKTEPVRKIDPAQELDLNQLFGPDRQVQFGGSIRFSYDWLPGTTRYLQRQGRGMVQVDAETGAVEPYDVTRELSAALAKIPGISGSEARRAAGRPQWNTDRTAALFQLANDVFYYRLGSEHAVRLTQSPEEERLVAFSPNGRMASFVLDHNLYVVDVEGGPARALTTGGSEQLLHGELDWVYQEELYGRGEFRGYWWSPDSQSIAFLQLDERPVHRYTVADGIPYRESLEVTPYPKAGDPLPLVQLGIVPAAGGDVRWVEHYEYSPEDLLVVRVDWNPNSEQLTYQTQNRAQTWLDLRAVDVSSGSANSRRLLRETTEAWVSVLGPPVWLKDGSFLWFSERSGNQHIYHVSADGQQVSPVTAGPWDVTTLYGVSPDEKWVYFAGHKDTALRAHGYRVKVDGSQFARLTDDDGSHSVRFNDTFTHFFDFSSSAHCPPQARLYRADGTYLRTVDPNRVDYLEYYRLNRPEFLQVPARDGLLLDAMLIKPPDFDPSRKYPVIVYVYAGPQSPVVADRWSGTNYLWHQMLAQKGYCIWMCDNRLATHRGARLAWSSFQKLGQEELKDIEDGIGWLKKQPWVDAQRIGIHGWSYGGYMTSYALTHSASFKAGIAGAPVTDWRNYDAVYTERYMGLPQQNPEGYASSSVVAAAGNLHGRLLLIHGTQDDNVHLGNTLQLAYALQQAGKQFDLMVYPKSRHGVGDARLNRHLRQMMTQFFLDNL